MCKGNLPNSVESSTGQGHLPVDSQAVNEDRVSLLRSGLTESFKKDQDARCLLVVQAGVEAYDDIVEEYIDIRDFERLKRSDLGLLRLN